MRTSVRTGSRISGWTIRVRGSSTWSGPEQGLTQPGLVIVCGDSHTSTHGAVGAIAFGIGSSEVAHVMATQALWQKRPRTMRITVDGERPSGRHGQGRDPCDHCADRGRGRHRICRRVCRPADRGVLDGGALHRLQHVDRGGGALRHDRAGLEDLRLPRRAPVRPEGGGAGARDGLLAGPAQRPRGRVRPRGAVGRRSLGAHGHLGHQSGECGRGDGGRAGSRGCGQCRAERGDRGRDRLYGARRRAADPGHRGGQGLHRLLYQQPDRGPARRGGGGQGPPG